MPTIEITDHDFTRLQKVAVPFIDTPATAFTKVMDAFERSIANTDPAEAPVQAASNLPVYHHDNLPPLTHTKLLEARFGGVQPEKAAWDALVRLALVEVRNKVGTVQDLRKIAVANVVEGRKDDEGYKFLPETASPIRACQPRTRSRSSSAARRGSRSTSLLNLNGARRKTPTDLASVPVLSTECGEPGQSSAASIAC